jgi:hypothetical protein
MLEQFEAARAIVNYRLVARGWKAAAPARRRTTYIVGLFGTGRWYVNDLVRRNIGRRAIYFTEALRCHPGPTSMIYSGHATMRHASRAQESPAFTAQMLESVRSRFADLIFVYRHPLDSLLTNWIWWRTFIRHKIMIVGISQIYTNTDDLCRDLELNFLEFKAFADGDPGFFATLPGPRFLSFPEFTEETVLFHQSASLSLRLEDFGIDPLKELAKIAQLMSVDLDLSRLRVVPPKSKPYRHLAVAEKVPQFRNYIDGLDAQTKKRIETIGYKMP